MVTPLTSSGIQNASVTALNAQSARAQTALEILQTTGDLRDVRAAIQKLSGEVTSVSRDGTVVIHTEKGDIVARVPADAPPLKPGQAVTLDVPAGKPPTTATAQAQSPTSAPSPQPDQPDIFFTPSTPKSSTDASEISSNLRAQALGPNGQPIPLKPGQIIQLTPLSLADAIETLGPSAPLLATFARQNQIQQTSGDTWMTLFKAFTENPEDSPALLKTMLSQFDHASTKEPSSSRTYTPPPFPPQGIEGRIDALIPGIRLPVDTPELAHPEPHTLGLVSLGARGNTSSIMMVLGSDNALQTGTFYMPQAGSEPLPTGTYMRVTQQKTLPFATPVAHGPTDITAAILENFIADLFNDLNALSAQHLYAGSATTPPIARAGTPETARAAALFFIAALRAGDVGEFLGEPAMTALKTKKASTLEKIENLFRMGREKILEPAGQNEFKTFLFPMQLDQTIHTIKLHTRREDDQGNPNEQPHDNKRFILEVNFDRMGPVQLDMLYQHKQLDTILRTQLPLSRGMQGVLQTTYTDAMGNVGHAGQLYFQDGLHTWAQVGSQKNSLQITA